VISDPDHERSEFSEEFVLDYFSTVGYIRHMIMKMAKYGFGFVFLLMTVGLLNCIHGSEQYGIFLTASVHGEIEPCG